MTEQITNSLSDAIKNITILYEKETIRASEFDSWLKNKHGDKNLKYWEQIKSDTFKKLKEKNSSHMDLPKNEREEFYESLKITGCFQQLITALTNLTSVGQNPFYQKYMDCQKPEFLNAKKALIDNLPMLIAKHKEQFHLDFKKTFFAIPEIKNYLGSFIFNMKNKHSGKYELIISKKVRFPTTVDATHNSAIFRFMDCVTEAFKKARYDVDNNILNSEEIACSIFLPKIWNGCGYCDDENPMTFNHEDGTVDEMKSHECPHAKKDITKQKSKISTTGKLIFCNDVRDFAPSLKMDDKIRKFGQQKNISTYLNTWEGQQGFMAVYAQLFNVAYFTAGNHGARLKQGKKGLKITYGDNEKNALSDISLSLWAVSLIDYQDAVKLAGSEETLLENLEGMEHYIVDVKPGTYEATVDCEATEEKAYRYKKNDLAFGELTWLNAETQITPLTDEEWQNM